MGGFKEKELLLQGDAGALNFTPQIKKGGRMERSMGMEWGGCGVRS